MKRYVITTANGLKALGLKPGELFRTIQVYADTGTELITNIYNRKTKNNRLNKADAIELNIYLKTIRTNENKT